MKIKHSDKVVDLVAKLKKVRYRFLCKTKGLAPMKMINHPPPTNNLVSFRLTLVMLDISRNLETVVRDTDLVQ